MRALVPLLALSLAASAADLRLVTVDPAHFHASQLHSGPLPGFSRDAYVYAPIGSDIAGYWLSVAGWTAQSIQPDFWRFHSYTGSDYMARFEADRPGDVHMLSGPNRRKIEYLEAGIALKMHALVDKPWIIEASDFDRLRSVYDKAEANHLVIYDCMSQRFDIGYQLERELVMDPAIFGQVQPGTPEQPAARLASSHFLLKSLNGIARMRPTWYFDIRQQGEALADVGTHVVDLAHWTLFPGQALDWQKDIKLVAAKRWPTILTLEQFKRVTGEPKFPASVSDAVKDGKLYYYTNNSLIYTTCGVHIAVQVSWDFESPAGDKDTMLAIYRGTRSEVAALALKEQSYLPEIYVTPLAGADRAQVRAAIENRLRLLAGRWPGLTVEDQGSRFHVAIPSNLRVNDVEFFLQLAEKFAGYIRKPGTMPAWEKPDMLVKYYVTTRGVELARASERKSK